MEQQFKELLEIHQKIKELKKQRENRMIELNMEVWRYIDGYDKYAVSSFGNIKNVKTGRILKPMLSKKGYHRIDLSNKNNKRRRSVSIHRVVASMFIPNLDNKPLIGHINNDKSDNSILNLRWCTNQENIRNIGVYKSNISSGIKGISYDKTARGTKKWKVTIRAHKHIIYTERFYTLEEAKVARINKANELFGDFTNQCEKL
jgi:hypothetical protein